MRRYFTKKIHIYFFTTASGALNSETNKRRNRIRATTRYTNQHIFTRVIAS